MYYNEELEKLEKEIIENVEGIVGIETRIIHNKILKDEFDTIIRGILNKERKNISVSTYLIIGGYNSHCIFAKSIINMIDIIGLPAGIKVITSINNSLSAIDICNKLMGEDNTFILRNIYMKIINDNKKYNYPFMIYDCVMDIVYSFTGEYNSFVIELLKLNSIVHNIDSMRKMINLEDSNNLYNLSLPLKKLKIALLNLKNINLEEVLENVKS